MVVVVAVVMVLVLSTEMEQAAGKPVPRVQLLVPFVFFVAVFSGVVRAWDM